MQRLSGTDTLFLSGENPAWHQHVGGFVIVDPAELPDFSFEAVRDFLLRHIDHVPKYRWRIKEVPLHLDRPVWVDDTNFDIDRHVRRAAVPAPGGRVEVGDLVGHLMSHQLDRRIPLWEFWYIDGIAGGKVGLFTRQHHCLMDGVSGAGLADQLLDIEPNPDPAARPVAPAEEASAGPEPSDLELLIRALFPALNGPRRMLGYALRTAQRGVTMARFLKFPPALGQILGQPVTALNDEIGPRRKLCYASVSLEDLRLLRKELDVKVNDIVLALCAASLRRYLLERDQLPSSSLMATVPMSTKMGGGHDTDNQLASMLVSLCTEIDDPVARVHAIKTATQAAKDMTQAVRTRHIQSVGEIAPPFLINAASRAMWASHLFHRLPVAMHVTVSNVPGPSFPLYVCGAPVSGFYAASVLMANMALNVTCISYIDRIDFGITVDPDIVKDHWSIADGIPSALAELMHATGIGEPTEVQDPFTP